MNKSSLSYLKSSYYLQEHQQKLFLMKLYSRIYRQIRLMRLLFIYEIQHKMHVEQECEMQGAIAAGLSMKLIVTFETATLDSFTDQLKIVTDGQYSINIPLHAFPAQAAIIYEPFINLGFVRVRKEKVDKIHFQNEGKAAGRVELKLDKIVEFRIEPNSFTLIPGQEFTVTVFYKPRDAGIFRGIIEVFAEGQQSGLNLKNPIEINATSIQFTRFLIDQNGTQSNTFHFGTMFYGQQKQIEAYLINNTPRQQKFKVKLKQGLHEREETLKLQTPAELGLEQTERIMECWPEEGVIEQYSQVTIIFKCKPKVNEELQMKTRQFALNQDKKIELEEFHYSAIFDFNDDEPLIILLFIVFVHKLNFLLFKLYNLDIVFEVSNMSKVQSILIGFPTIPYFSVNPQLKKLAINEKINFWVTFRPKHVGQFSNVLNAELLGGVFKIPIKVTGICSQMLITQNNNLEKELIRNFQRSFYLWNHQNINRLSIMDSLNIELQSFEMSQIVSFIILIGVDKIEEMKRLNKDKYNEYLKQHREQKRTRISKQKKNQVDDREDESDKKMNHQF
ncbi:unnamed protein product [Paramecium sonneborni]|uniref:Abnormal spindle-like microcephaly-associated protein ASH domain-containing protein n=1 Tax=Paramecium sonneborni TaxID=65129 RepID=A0A8S1QYY9_9CILI|nr:unnamed protein product [Paramecium sonneborni]